MPTYIVLFVIIVDDIDGDGKSHRGFLDMSMKVKGCLSMKVMEWVICNTYTKTTIKYKIHLTKNHVDRIIIGMYVSKKLYTMYLHFLTKLIKI